MARPLDEVYCRCLYNNIIQNYSQSHKDRLYVVRFFMNQTLRTKKKKDLPSLKQSQEFICSATTYSCLIDVKFMGLLGLV